MKFFTTGHKLLVNVLERPVMKSTRSPQSACLKQQLFARPQAEQPRGRRSPSPPDQGGRGSCRSRPRALCQPNTHRLLPRADNYTTRQPSPQLQGTNISGTALLGITGPPNKLLCDRLKMYLTKECFICRQNRADLSPKCFHSPRPVASGPANHLYPQGFWAYFKYEKAPRDMFDISVNSLLLKLSAPPSLFAGTTWAERPRDRRASRLTKSIAHADWN